MYLSRLVLDPSARRTLHELANPYELHRTVFRAFPEADDGGSGRVLYRVDLDPRGGPPCVLIQSDRQPNWSFLDEGPAFLIRDGRCKNPDWREVRLAFAAGQPVAFRLRANPTKREQSTGKRVGLMREEDQLAWLQRKGETGGFAVLRATIIPEGVERSLAGRGAEPPLTFLAVRYEGLLRVIDPDRFAETLADGLGSGKGLGFGLLSVAEAR